MFCVFLCVMSRHMRAQGTLVAAAHVCRKQHARRGARGARIHGADVAIGKLLVHNEGGVEGDAGVTDHHKKGVVAVLWVRGP